MNSPFQFGKIVTGSNFTNRSKDIARLRSNFNNKINTILISPRRWGKSSLVKNTSTISLKKNDKLVYCFIDLFNLRDEEEFYASLSKGIISATSSKTEEWINTAKTYLGKISPQIKFGVDPNSEFEINFRVEDTKQHYKEILDLPEKIASKKQITIVLCLDEFQNIEHFSEPMLFQKRLRSSWQHHNNVVYCLYGSKQHMLIELFANQSMPFYKFGDVIHLDKITQDELNRFIIKQFRNTKKDISDTYANKIIELMDRHPYYVQQLCHLVWLNTKEKVTKSIYTKSVDELLNQNSLLFEREVENLSNTQLNFLKALANDEFNNKMTKEIIAEYKLNSTSNIVKIKKALVQKEIVTIEKSIVYFIDPAFQLWIKTKLG